MQEKEFEPRKLILPGLLVVGLIVLTYWRSAQQIQNYHLQGETMGTSYSIKLPNSQTPSSDIRSLKQEIDLLLGKIDVQMSTWRNDSEISRFNLLKTEHEIPMSPGFYDVLFEGIQIGGMTGFAFNPQILPLVELWGFSSQGEKDPPSPEAVSNALELVQGSLELRKDIERNVHMVKKHSPGLKLDLSGVAKGFAVDLIVERIAQKGHQNFYVEIGGELRTRGFNQDKKPWRIGIPVPETENFSERYMDLQLSGFSAATSGDYRNFRIDDNGQRISHIIDPRTGYPVKHMLASVTVIANTCARADGLATGLFVMGRVEGLKRVEQLENVEALFIYRDGNQFRHAQSSGWQHFIAPTD